MNGWLASPHIDLCAPGFLMLSDDGTMYFRDFHGKFLQVIQKARAQYPVLAAHTSLALTEVVLVPWERWVLPEPGTNEMVSLDMSPDHPQLADLVWLPCAVPEYTDYRVALTEVSARFAWL